jgi:hypothetical protein
MRRRCRFPEDGLAEMREAVGAEPRLVAIYVFGMYQPGDCDMAALFSETPSWPERLDLELVVARTLGLEGVQLVDLRRMPLAFRYWVISHGEAIYTGEPRVLATFIEETLARYSAFYPLLEALYWEVEATPLPEDMLNEEPGTMNEEQGGFH